MNMTNRYLPGLLLTLILLVACASSNVNVGKDSSRPEPQQDLFFIGNLKGWASYPILAHKLQGEEAPIVRWIDTDSDGVSNYRLLCTFENGRVRVCKVVLDRSFRQKFRQAHL